MGKWFSTCIGLLIIQVSISQQSNMTVGTNQQQPLFDVVHFKKLKDSSQVLYERGNFQKALNIDIEALKESLLSNNPQYIHEGYRNLGYAYLAINDTVLAKESFTKSQKFAINSESINAIATAYRDFANLYQKTGQKNKVARFQQAALQLFEKTQDSAQLAFLHFEMATTDTEPKALNAVYLHLLKAKNYDISEENSVFKISLNLATGNYYFIKFDYDTAIKYYKMVITAAEAQNLITPMREAYWQYAESLSKKGNYKQAYDILKRFDAYKMVNSQNDTIADGENISADFQVSEYRKDIQAAELANELQAENVKNKTNLNIILFILAGTFLAMFIAFFIAYRRRKQLVEELKVKNQKYLLAKEQTEKLSKDKSKFFSTVSHELRTPLYGVIGLSTILLEDKNLKNHEEDLKSLKFSADYLLALINDVLQLNKIDSKLLDDEKSIFEIRKLVKTIASSFEYMRLQNKNVFEINIDEDVPVHVKGNSVRLSQILMNLIGNACKFTENGVINIIIKQVNTENNVSSINFAVKDTGIGIPKEKQESIFDEFSQLDSLNYTYQGTGLGLPIVKKLLALSDSTIVLISDLGKGSIFSFTIKYDSVENIETKEIVQDCIQDSEMLRNKKILIVEDNRINQIVTKKILEKNNIFCEIAENGAIAVEKTKNGNFDLILMDINMPIMDGIQATKNIRNFNTSVPIVALTAVEVEEMRNKIFSSGMNDIIVKPYDVNKFLQTIMKQISFNIELITS